MVQGKRSQAIQAAATKFGDEVEQKPKAAVTLTRSRPKKSGTTSHQVPTPSAPRSRPTKRQRVGEGKGDGDDSGDDNDDVHPSRKIPTNKKAESVSKPTSSTRLPGKARASPLDKDEKKTKTKTNRVFKPKPKPPTTTATTAPSLPDINQPPTEVLAVLVFGNGDAGELGLGPKLQDAARPRLNTYLDPDDPSAMHIVQLDCGGMHTIALTDDNRIVTWGVNDNGALGRNTDWEGGLRELRSDEGSEEEEDEGELNPQESIPTPISVDVFPPGTEFVQVAASDSCSLALTSTGLVYGWGTFKNPEGKEMFGYDANGKIITKQTTPTLIRQLRRITQITCGANHALALDAKGVIWAWGCGEQNQLGRLLFGRRFMECLNPHPVEIKGVKQIASGEYHSFAIDNRDNVWSWGLNSFGEAGDVKTAGGDLAIFPTKIRALCAKGVICLDGGAHHSAAVTADGQCFVWGRLDGGQLGIDFSPGQLQDENLVRYDEREKPRICLRPTLVPELEVGFVACGTDHTIFITKGGTPYVTSFNSQGQLGLGKEDDDVMVARPIQSKGVKDRVLAWAGAGGQFSMVAEVVKPSADI